MIEEIILLYFKILHEHFIYFTSTNLKKKIRHRITTKKICLENRREILKAAIPLNSGSVDRIHFRR